MKALKISLISIISIFVLIYAAFLFILPNAVNLNNYKSDIYKLVKDSSGLDLNVKDLKLLSTPSVKIKLVAKDVSLKYPDGKDFLHLADASVEIPLYPLLYKTLRFDKISITSPAVSLEILNDGRFDIEKFLAQNLAKQDENAAQQELPIRISEKLPDIYVKHYLVKIQDPHVSAPILINGEKFNLTDIVLNKSLKLYTSGSLSNNDKDLINYDVKISTFLPEIQAAEQTAESTPQIDIISNLIKYAFKTDVKADLAITRDKDANVNVKGYFNADKISFKIRDKVIENSFADFIFDGNKINMKSDIFVGTGEKASLDGKITYGKKPYIDMKVEAKSLNFVNLQNIAVALLDIANMKDAKNELNNFVVNGSANLDFSIKSDMKRVESRGHALISDANIAHKQLPLKISSINSNIDFSNNNINIKKTSAMFNDAPFRLSGIIKSNSDTNIKINAQNLSLVKLFDAFAPKDLKAAYGLQGGNLNLDVTLKGKLDKLIPVANVDITSLALKDKVNNFILSSSSVKTSISSDLKTFSGNLKSENVKINLVEFSTILNANKINVDFDDKNLKINPMQVLVGTSPISVSGDVKDYNSKMKLDILAKGKLNASDIKAFAPKENQSMLIARGSLPLIARVTGDGINNSIDAQILANSGNYITVIDLKQLLNKTSILNLSVQTSSNELKLNDIALLSLGSDRSLSDNMKLNTSGGAKVAGVTGKIGAINTKTPTFNSIKINVPNEVSFSIPGMKDSNAALKTDILINGNVQKPLLKGYINVLSASIPDFSLSAQNLEINFDNDILAAKSPMIDIKGSKFDFDATASTNFSKGLIINNLRLNSSYFNLDNLISVLDKMPQNAMAPGADIPVTINKGVGTIKSFKMGNLAVSNCSSDFTLKNNSLKLGNLTATAYNGSISGSINYNLKYLTMDMSMKGNSLDANPAITAFMGLKDQLMGKLDFDAVISMSGVTEKQQMQSLKGTANFLVSDGQMGSLGKFEHFLFAQNLVSQSLIKTSLGTIASQLTPKNTGQFKYLKGNMSFANGYATISPIESSGKNMSLYITGKLNLLNNYGDIDILGKISPEVVNALGPVGELSLSNLASNIPKFGISISNILNSYNAEASNVYIAKIPPLQLATEQTRSKDFKVKILGDTQSASSVKSFQWLNTREAMSEKQSQLNQSEQSQNMKESIQNSVQQKTQQLKNTIQNTIQQAIPTTPATTTPATTAPENGVPNKSIIPKVPDFVKTLPEFLK